MVSPQNRKHILLLGVTKCSFLDETRYLLFDVLFVTINQLLVKFILILLVFIHFKQQLYEDLSFKTSTCYVISLTQ